MPCLASHGIAVAVAYQPLLARPVDRDRIFLALAALLAGFCYWRVGRRLP